MGPCGDNAPCFRGHNGPMHDDLWHENERLRGALLALADDHTCDNCSGVDPRSCLFNPAAAAALRGATLERQNEG